MAGEVWRTFDPDQIVQVMDKMSRSASFIVVEFTLLKIVY
jgi:hypothetical protein